MRKKILVIVVLLCVIVSCYFSMGFLIEKHKEAMVARITITNPPHPVGSDCIFEDIPVAIYNKYLDEKNQWMYNVIVIELNTTVTIGGVPHRSLKDCKE
jgi:hypothetical protein